MYVCMYVCMYVIMLLSRAHDACVRRDTAGCEKTLPLCKH